MASSAMHWEQAEHNCAFCRHLAVAQPIAFKDWAVIGAFYAAVHFVESLRDSVDGSHSEVVATGSPHRERCEYVDVNLPYHVAKSYRLLYQASRILRYLECQGKKAPSVKGSYLQDAAVKRHIEVNLERVKAEVARRLNKTLAS